MMFNLSSAHNIGLICRRIVDGKDSTHVVDDKLDDSLTLNSYTLSCSDFMKVNLFYFW